MTNSLQFALDMLAHTNFKQKSVYILLHWLPRTNNLWVALIVLAHTNLKYNFGSGIACQGLYLLSLASKD